jgi:RNA polymerase sigma-70 factor, ECF subfamily
VDDFEAWYRGSAPRLAAALAVVAGDADVGREAAAEACTRALERWSRVREMSSPEGWAHTVGVNLIRRRWRRAAMERRVVSKAGRAAVGAAPSLNPELWLAVRSLPLRQRQAVALRYVLDLTQEQVAAAMGVAPGTAAATLSTARRQLRAALDDPEPDESEEAKLHDRA